MPIPAWLPASIQASRGLCKTRPSASVRAPTQVMRFFAKRSCSSAALLVSPCDSDATQASFSASLRGPAGECQCHHPFTHLVWLSLMRGLPLWHRQCHSHQGRELREHWCCSQTVSPQAQHTTRHQGSSHYNQGAASLEPARHRRQGLTLHLPNLGGPKMQAKTRQRTQVRGLFGCMTQSSSP